MTLKKSQSSDPEADTLVLGLAPNNRASWRQPGGLPSEALAKGEGNLGVPAPALRRLIWNRQYLATHCAGGLGL